MEMVNSKNSFRFLNRFLSILVILAMTLGNSASLSALAKSDAAPLSAPTTLHLSVISAADSNDVADTYNIVKGQPITDFKYIINIDNTGTTEQRSPADGCSPSSPGYPDSCNWVSVAGRANHSPIYTQGTQDDFPGGIFTIDGAVVNMPAGRYLISVLADNFKIDGAHFTISPTGGDLNVTVEMQPYDLPSATVQAAVFEDMMPTNSAPDLPAERGLAGFRAHINDYIDEVTTDVYGNPLGASYDASGNYIPGTGGVVLSKCYVVANGEDIGTVNPVNAKGECPLAFTTAEDPLLANNINQTIEGRPIPVGAAIEGKVVIPNVGPNRYALSVTPPSKSGWIQTTTLEGNHDWDAWVMEGATGLDTEFVVASEPFPATFFGFVPPSVNTMTGGTNTITGRGVAINALVPPKGGLISGEGVRGGQPKDGNPIPNPIRRLFVSLSDLNANDQTVFVKEFGCESTPVLDCTIPPGFSIPNIPDGDYVLGVWDEPQDYMFNFQNVSVSGGVIQDAGDVTLLGWWSPVEGYVFNDLNENGKRDPGEPGISNFFISMRNRENSLMDRGSPSTTTDANGYYWLESAYPMNQWQIIEAYADGFHTTGVTYWADNQPEPTTVLGAGVDVNYLPVFSQSGHLDWGVKAYNPGENGGIVGTVSYDTTRNELDPSYAAIEDWQPSISDLTVNLYAPIPCGTHTNTACDEAGLYELAQDGSYALGGLLNSYLSETWERPSGCIARDVNGVPLVHGVDENALPLDPNAPCLEAPMTGVQFGPMESDQGTPDANFGASVDGNYGFGDGCYLADGVTPGLFDPDTQDCVTGTLQALPSNRDYLVKVEIPDDPYGRPLYQVTREEDINVAAGDSFVPQVPPPACAGPLHTVDLQDVGTDNYPAVDVFGNGSVIVPASAPVHNPPFVDMGGTIYEGQQKNLCDMKLVHLADQKSIAPGFNFYTDVPLPGRFWGLLVDDLNWSSNPQSLLYGEKMGIPFAPVGIYDYTNRLITTVESDYNGLFDVLLPSTNRISCPTPSGVCANLYRFVGNDPGIPGHWNANYTSQYRTISAEFEAFPGLTVPADLAPTQVAVSVQLPGMQTATPIMCTVEDTQPQLMAVSKPYANISSAADSFTINGAGFGTSGQVLLDNVALPTTGWSNTSIDVTVPLGTVAGTHQLSIVGSSGKKTINGLTFHVFNSAPATVSSFPTNGSALDTFSNPPAYNFSANWTQNGSAYTAVNNTGTNNDYLRVRSSNNQINNAWRSTIYGTSQEAYVTFVRKSGNLASNQQGLLLKYNGSGGSPNGNAARWVAVVVDNNNDPDPEGGTVRVLTKTGNGAPVEQLVIDSSNAVFSDGDQLGARALGNGTIIVYKNGSEIGRVSVNATSGMSGRIGLRFEGTGGASTEARLDNFGGGNTTFTSTAPYAPVLFEVGPGKPFSNIQSAIDAAAAQGTYRDSLVVVYPAAPDLNNPRSNGRGAYYENPIMYAPVQLQGVGPGGVRPDGSVVNGSLIDGIAFGGDTTLATNWLGKVGTLTWDGNQDINDGQVIYVLASNGNTRATLTEAGSFNSTTFKPTIDGFDIRGGDQQGIPPNLVEVAGTLNPNANLPVQVVTQGGAIFANSYVTNLQITNNVIESNGGAYGTIRIGTPNIGDQNNDNLRIANNRILSNGGTNLAGAIGLFNGADNYEVAYNDLCGNFSAEYGGGISHFGYSPNGKIHDNRIYFNRSYDEGAGIMIAGELATNPNANYGQPGGPRGSGAVDIYNNLVQANLADDDGGGIRFLMAGNFPMNVYNNMIVNNVSTHEGGGVALDDASNVRFYNNTVMNNKTTATAITSNGQPAPTGLSTGPNSTALQASLPGGSPTFSNPLLFNNIFYNNWAGTNTGGSVTGISSGDANPWDMGSLSAGILLSPTNSVLQTNTGTNPSGTNTSTNPGVVTTLDIPMTFTNWGAFVTTLMVTAQLPPTLMGDYHLANTSSPARNAGAASKALPAFQQPPASRAAPTIDIDNQGRPGGGGFDMGADEVDGTVIGGGGGGNPTMPTLAVLDNFNRTNANTLGGSWSQVVTLGNAGIRVNNNQAFCINSGLAALLCTPSATATWSTSLGNAQGAAFTFASTTLNNTALVLKAGTGSLPSSFIRVRYETTGGGQVVVATTTNSGGSYSTLSTFTGVSFANGDTLTAVANADGSVDVWKTTAANVTTFIGHSATSSFTGSGRVGLQLPSGGRVDNFSGGTLP